MQILTVVSIQKQNKGFIKIKLGRPTALMKGNFREHAVLMEFMMYSLTRFPYPKFILK
jgi:hypothetical protein